MVITKNGIRLIAGLLCRRLWPCQYLETTESFASFRSLEANAYWRLKI